MSGAVSWLDRALYPGIERNWDDGLLRERILAALTPVSVVLDLGAGAGIVAAMDFRSHAARICGVDLDPRVVSNPYLDEGRIASGAAIPYPDASFDLVFADNVAEHLDDPQSVLREVARVLKPGGRFFIKTPNSWHYMPLISRLTPHGFHRWVNRLRGRAESDTFPTRYRANSKKTLEDLARQTGLDVIRIERIEGRPEYMRMSAASYLVGAAYERLVNASSRLARLRILLIGELRKPDSC